MTQHPLRAAVLFVVALVLLSGVAYVVQQASAGLPTGGSAAGLPPVAPPPPGEIAPVASFSTRSSARSSTRAAGTAVPQVSASWLRRTATAAGLPEVALQAYARAELQAPASCHLGWTTLAGVGWVESQNGTLGGRTLQADGHSSSPIIGPPLDGTHHTQAIAATPESTVWHGDPTWDHAVGPMQFLPSTWEQWAADGDGDGVADPNDIDDAALAAAGYLCADGHDLATAQGWTDAIVSYNHDQAYLDAVHAAAVTYAQRTAG